jgi:hypothetical protein
MDDGVAVGRRAQRTGSRVGVNTAGPDAETYMMSVLTLKHACVSAQRE